jgi:hypothetical protein
MHLFEKAARVIALFGATLLVPAVIWTQAIQVQSGDYSFLSLASSALIIIWALYIFGKDLISPTLVDRFRRLR